ncbi:hypothetical protein TcasGA2_TC007085 [Tribolium castaneum]|uniref:Uncharacterized protein n=1 Tax=Tribolium castaneum TaxID=7070 RepID=D2A1L7_TRICA|nr:hypothetical protein TcasGA2_TC007085 [Tribolium castaneum]
MPSPCDSCKETCGDGQSNCGKDCKCGDDCKCSADGKDCGCADGGQACESTD